eukprot:561881-Heterocapsa_arctica.AAC.1
MYRWEQGITRSSWYEHSGRIIRPVTGLRGEEAGTAGYMSRVRESIKATQNITLPHDRVSTLGRDA